MENKDEILKQLREFERQRNAEIDALKEQIQAVKERCKEQSSPFKEALNTIASDDIYTRLGVKEGDVLELRYGFKGKTRNVRVDYIYAEVLFREWGGVEHNIVNYKMIGSHLKKDGTDGERNIPIYENDIVKRDKQAA